MRILFLSLLLLFPSTVMAAEAKHAVAMHGEPKYGPDFTHLEYANPDAPKGGTLKQHVIGAYDSLNPFIIKGTPAAGMTFIRSSLYYTSLMQNALDEPFSLYGIIAKSIEIPEDRSSVSFNLRPEAKWNDGKPITSGDVLWTFNTLRSQGAPFFKAYWGDVSEVIAENDRRITFKFSSTGNMELPLIIAEMTILPEHYWTAEGRDFGASSLTVPLGSGPYKIGKVDAGRSIEYVRNVDWWGKDLPFFKGQFNFDKIIYDYYRDDNVALEAFMAGDYDVRMENTAKLWHTAYKGPNFDSSKIIKEEIEHHRPAGMQAFIFNIRREIFKDPKVREALSYAFDFEWSNQQFAFGDYTRTDSYFENSDLSSSGLPSAEEIELLNPLRDKIPSAVFDETYTPPLTNGTGRNRLNLKKAQDLLKEAGYTAGSDGILQKDGKKLSFEILDSNPMFERWVLPFIKNLKTLGVEANFRVVDTAQYQNRINDFDFDMTIGGFGQSQSPGNEQRDFWGSEKADLPGSRNYIGIKDPAINELIEVIIRAGSREELVTAVHALDRILLHRHYVIPMWHYPKWRIARWDYINHPETMSGISPAITDTWWSTKK